MPSTGERKTTLCLVSDAFGSHGGIGLYMRDVLRCLAAADCDVTLTLFARTGEPDAATDVPDNIQWVTEALGGKWQYLRALLSYFASGAFPKFVLCGHINLMPFARLAATRYRVPLVLFIYGIDAWRPPKNWFSAKLSGSADKVVSISEITKQRYLSWSGKEPDDVHLVPNAIKLDRYGLGKRDPNLVARYGLHEKKVLMTLGRLSSAQKHKGVDEVIKVMPRLLKEVPDLVYLVAGGGDDISRLKQKAIACGVGENVVFTGYVNEKEKADHYRLADAFALTGHGDGFGFVLLEAMACGIPAVASVLDGSQEALLNGELGVLVNPSKPDSLVDGLLEALSKDKGIPPGLDYFAYPRFCERLRRSLEPYLVASG